MTVGHSFTLLLLLLLHYHFNRQQYSDTEHLICLQSWLEKITYIELNFASSDSLLCLSGIWSTPSHKHSDLPKGRLNWEACKTVFLYYNISRSQLTGTFSEICAPPLPPPKKRVKNILQEVETLRKVEKIKKAQPCPWQLQWADQAQRKTRSPNSPTLGSAVIKII